MKRFHPHVYVTETDNVYNMSQTLYDIKFVERRYDKDTNQFSFWKRDLANYNWTLLNTQICYDSHIKGKYKSLKRNEFIYIDKISYPVFIRNYCKYTLHISDVFLDFKYTRLLYAMLLEDKELEDCLY